MEATTKKPHLSHSGMSCYARCGEQYRRRYILGEIIPPAVAMITGSGCHKGLELTLKRKIETKALATDEEVAAAARDSVAAAFGSGAYLLSDEEAAEGVEKIQGLAIDEAVSCATLGNQELAPDVEPKAVERKWEVEIVGFPVNLVGIIDCDEGVIVDDWKTAGKSPSAGAADTMSQLTIYSLAKKILDGVLPKCRIGYMVNTKKPKALWQETQRTDADLQCLLRVLERTCEGIRKESFTFACAQDPRPWCCSPRFCGYYATCEGVNPKCSVPVDGMKSE